MIIVSQDKKRIVNFENIIDIWTGEKGTIFFTPIVNINGMDILGYYNTEERAKEVLQEITERYEGWQNLVYGQPSGICNPKYEMPKE